MPLPSGVEVRAGQMKGDFVQPEFPEFKPIQLEDRDSIQGIIDKYQPETSEWTFNNLFIWREHYGFEWSTYGDSLVILSKAEDQDAFFLQPIGPPSRLETVRKLLVWLREEGGLGDAGIERADQRLISELQGTPDLLIQPTRDHFDYVYRTEDLIRLSGNKYHSKKNHINKFMRRYSFNYEALEEKHLEACSELAESWCQWRRCEEDMNLLDEWEAVEQALKNFHALKLEGGVISIDGKVEAFALGERLNLQTTVVHAEKANPEIPELYAAINQQCCEKTWPQATWVNREQDLGEPGLRKAKLSYHPHRLIEKFSIRSAGDK
jgi:hypothetical protein